jgi:hypothetical protein
MFLDRPAPSAAVGSVGVTGPAGSAAARCGRGDVAGALGHRYAVAYGLAVLATS